MQQDRNYLSVWLEERKTEYVLRIPKSLPDNALRHRNGRTYAVAVVRNSLMRLSNGPDRRVAQIHPITIRVTPEEV